MNAQVQACAADARIVLRMEMLKETEAIYTQNEHYLEAYKAKFLGHYKQVRMKRPRSPSKIDLTIEEPAPPRPGSPYHDAYRRRVSPRESPTDFALRALRDAGYVDIKATDLPKLLPSHGLDPAFDIMAEVRAYFQGTPQPAFSKGLMLTRVPLQSLTSATLMLSHYASNKR